MGEGWEGWDSSAWKRGGLGENLTNVYEYMIHWCIEDGARLFSVLRTKGSGPRLAHKRARPSIREHFFIVLVTELWHQLPRVCGLSPWRASKVTWRLSWAICSSCLCLSWMGGKGWGGWTSRKMLIYLFIYSVCSPGSPNNGMYQGQPHPVCALPHPLPFFASSSDMPRSSTVGTRLVPQCLRGLRDPWGWGPTLCMDCECPPHARQYDRRITWPQFAHAAAGGTSLFLHPWADAEKQSLLAAWFPILLTPRFGSGSQGQ